MQADLKQMEKKTENFDKVGFFRDLRGSLENYVTANSVASFDQKRLDLALLDIIHYIDKTIREGLIDRAELDNEVLESESSGRRLISSMLAAQIRGYLDRLKDGQLPRRP